MVKTCINVVEASNMQSVACTYLCNPVYIDSTTFTHPATTGTHAAGWDAGSFRTFPRHSQCLAT
jgi:hypothetical protein